MKKIIAMLFICITISTLIVGCSKSSDNKNIIKCSYSDGTYKNISYNELYRNYEEYNDYEMPIMEFPVTIIYYNEKSEHTFDIDFKKVEELGDSYLNNPEQAYVYYTMYWYTIYGYVGDNKDNIVDISYNRIVRDDNSKEPEPIWKVKKGDKVNCVGYLSGEMSDYTNNGQTSKVPGFIVLTEQCKFID